MNNIVDNKKNVLISGSSGLVGSALTPLLESNGYRVFLLKRHQEKNTPYWDIEKQKITLNGCPEPDIIIHLAGENIANSRWTKKVKEKITNSRIQSTQLFVDFINKSKKPPALFICASAIGFYGDRGVQTLNEDSTKGACFVSDLAEKWEKTAQQAQTRVVNLRTGIVLSKKGGALTKMLPAFKLGLGGKIGSGKQVMSWIDLNDELNAILFIMNHPTLTGPVNLVSPHPVDNKIFSNALADILHRPCFLPMPAKLVELMFGQMGEELLLASTNVQPTKLLQAGFEFECLRLQESLNRQLT